MLQRRFSLFGIGDSSSSSSSSNLVCNNNKNNSLSSKGVAEKVVPTLKLETDREVYRPCDPLVVTIQISIPSNGYSFLVERLSFKIKGIEKLDTHWFATQKTVPGSKQKRGEHVFLEFSTPILIANQIVNAGTSKSYFEACLLNILQEVRIPLQIWINQKNTGILMDEDIVPPATVQLDIFWKEMDGDADWVRADDMYDGVDEGYDSSRDDISSVSSYNHLKGNVLRGFGSSPSLRSSSTRSLNRDTSALEGRRTSVSSNMALPRLSAAEVLSDSGPDVLSTRKSFGIVSPSEQQKLRDPFSPDGAGGSSSPEAGAIESLASEGFIRGRSYNIRLDDQVLLKYSPRNSDSTYYFSDMIGGTLTFFHEEVARRCLEISITLETSETINRRFVHPSRRNSPTITKVLSDHHEVVADLVQTSFLFSVPMDGPMSFSTAHVSVQWVLRFEFFTTPKHVDWKKYEHPLLIEGRDKTEWVLPITVHALPPRTPASGTRNEKLFSLDPMWVHN
ncbi:hypothetical protein TanjilG_25287 [Lupinus angustifolius]|uniref:Uncharacterized protein n=1 Tax=Lupinus angustifolius TaxID=3871 RepID=A0A4P1RUU0_LUPAN|nr:hypothetical protein TanjilG_25287 [Lupinus angustifolius]